jgi:cholesterol transport system auxiliary component
MKVMRIRLTALAGAMLALSGCFGGHPPAELLTLTPAQTRDPAQPRAATQGHVITVTVPSAPRSIANNRVPVYVSPTTIQYVRGATWAETPTELFRNLLSETLAAKTQLVVLDPSVYTQIQGMVLSGQLLQFGLDPNRNEVVVLYEATLTRPENSVTTNRFEVRVPVADATPGAIGVALNQAANQVADQVSTWVGG